MLLGLQKLALSRGYLRAVNYHGTAMETADSFERQLAFYAEHFTSVSLADLDKWFACGCWEKDRPGLILSFDDGLSSNYTVAAPLMEKYGFLGWFFVPVDFVSAAAFEQPRFAKEHDIYADATSLGAERVAMSWDQLRDLNRRQHVIGCHTRSHRRMHPDLSEAELEYEIRSGKAQIEASMGQECACFCWVGGEQETYTRPAAQMIRKSGYRYAFTTNSFPITPRANPLRMERNNVESSWPVSLASFQICGIQDLRLAPKRRRVAQTIEAP